MPTLRRFAWFAVSLALVPYTGCASEVVTPQTSGTTGEGGDYAFLTGEGGSTSSSPTPPEPPRPPVPPDYDDPGCERTPPPVEAFTCDPFDGNGGGCAVGEACKISIEYPSEPCGQEIYGSYCAPAGTGQQGDDCSDAGVDCGAGFVCVITGSGTQCVQLCKVDGPSGCPSGLVCEPIDVKGFGGCL